MIQQQNDSFLASQSEEEEKSQDLNQQLSLKLEESRKNCQIYVLNLKQIALTPISQQIMNQYSGKINPNYSKEDIFRLINKRISKMIRNKKIKKNWNVEDIIVLLWIISKYLQYNKFNSTEDLTNQDWKFISKVIPGSTPKGCMFKFISLKKTKLSHIYWSKDQEHMLLSLVQKHGLNHWKQISQILYQQGKKQKVFRTPKQCRQHWNCYLDPKLKKGPWSQQQDIKLLQNVRQNKGQRKWSSIKHLFDGRTQNALKNRYNLLIERQRKNTPQKTQKQLIKQYLKGQNITKVTNNKHNNFKLQIQSQQKQKCQIKNAKLNKKEQIYEEDQIDEPLLGSEFKKSRNSSFHFSQIYKKSLSQSTISSPIQKNCENILIMNINSIYSNDQGFYMYKPYYQ